MTDAVQIQYVMSPLGSHTQNTSLASVVSVTAPDYCNAVLLTARTQNVNFTLDGSTPTVSKGNLLKAGDASLLLPVTAGQTLKFIEEAASAKLDYQFVKM